MLFTQPWLAWRGIAVEGTEDDFPWPSGTPRWWTTTHAVSQLPGLYPTMQQAKESGSRHGGPALVFSPERAAGPRLLRYGSVEETVWMKARESDLSVWWGGEMDDGCYVVRPDAQGRWWMSMLGPWTRVFPHEMPRYVVRAVAR